MSKIGNIKLEIQGDIKDGDCFIVIGPGFYGYGNSIKEAKAACMRAGCKAKMKMLAYYGDADVGVTGFGEIRAPHLLIALGEV